MYKYEFYLSVVYKTIYEKNKLSNVISISIQLNTKYAELVQHVLLLFTTVGFC